MKRAIIHIFKAVAPFLCAYEAFEPDLLEEPEAEGVLRGVLGRVGGVAERRDEATDGVLCGVRSFEGERLGEVIGVAKLLGDALLALDGEGARERDEEGERLTDDTVEAVLGVARRSTRRPRLPLPRSP